MKKKYKLKNKKQKKKSLKEIWWKQYKHTMIYISIKALGLKLLYKDLYYYLSYHIAKILSSFDTDFILC